MKQLSTCIFCILFMLVASYAEAQQKTKKAVFIIVDGVPADVIEKLPTPNLHSIAKQGGYTRAYVGGEKGAYSETPTISAVGYNLSLIHISEPTRRTPISYAVFCLKKK